MAVTVGVVGLLSASCVEAAPDDDWLLPDDWQAVEILGGTVAMPDDLTETSSAPTCTSFSRDPAIDLCDPSTWADTSFGLTVLDVPPTVGFPGTVLPRTARWQPFVAADVEPDELGRGAAITGFSLPARYTRPPGSVTAEVVDTTSDSSGAPLRQLRAANGDTLAIVGLCTADDDAGFCRGVRELLADDVAVATCRHHRPSTNIDCRLTDDLGIRIFQGLVDTSELERLRDSI